jgi:hypothetical protein
MKFFTRDLYRRCQSRDESILDAACAEWEQANEAYARHLAAQEVGWPPHLRQFADLLLHDAKVQSIARQDHRLILVLHKDIPPREVVILRCDLIGDPTVEPFAEFPADWNRPTPFQFDEIDYEKIDNEDIYCQSIVFSNGWEMRLRFRDVQTTVAQATHPVPVTGTIAACAISQ